MQPVERLVQTRRGNVSPFLVEPILERGFRLRISKALVRIANSGILAFGHLIDETFDMIDDPKSRADRIVDVVADICYNGAASFLEAARSVCKYNYQQLREHNARGIQRFTS